MAYQSLDAQIAERELAGQTICAKADLVAGSSDLPTNIVIDNSTIAATTITFLASEHIKTCYHIYVTDRTTSAIVPTTAAPDVSVDKQATVTVDGTALSDVLIEVRYSVAQ